MFYSAGSRAVPNRALHSPQGQRCICDTCSENGFLSSSPHPTSLHLRGETGGLEALKPLRIKRIDFKDKVIYTHFSPPECWCGNVESAAKAATAQRVTSDCTAGSAHVLLLSSCCIICLRVICLFPPSLLVFSEDGGIMGYFFFFLTLIKVIHVGIQNESKYNLK